MRFTKEKKEEITNRAIELYSSGMTCTAIGKELGVFPDTISSFLKSSGITVKKAGKPKPRISEDLENQVIELYKQGLTTYEIESKIGVSKSTTSRVMKRRNQLEFVRHNTEYKRTPQVKIDKCVELYSSGKSLKTVGKEVGLTPEGVRHALNWAGRSARNHTEVCREYYLDETVFDVIDTEEKAYWLGFITADGCVSSKRKALTFGLQERDYGHLEKFKKCLNTDSPINFVNGKSGSGKWFISARLSIFSSRLIIKLVELGIVDRKSTKEIIAKGIPSELMRHYWRGLFDGDGSISTKLSSISICGSRELMSEFLSTVTHLIGRGIELKSRETKTEHMDNLYFFYVCRMTDMKIVLNYLYGNSSIYLDRKMVLADKLINYKKNK